MLFDYHCVRWSLTLRSMMAPSVRGSMKRRFTFSRCFFDAFFCFSSLLACFM
jgi:hypothetical protein